MKQERQGFIQSIRSGIERHKKGIAVAAAISTLPLLGGCSKEEQKPQAGIITTTEGGIVVTETTTTTKPPETTTTTERLFSETGININEAFQGMIGSGIGIEEIKNISLNLPEDQSIINDSVPREVQAAFKKINPEYEFIYAGDGTSLTNWSNVLTNRPVKGLSPIEYQVEKFGVQKSEETKDILFINGIFNPKEGFYVFSDVDSNNSPIVYIKLTTEENVDMFARLDLTTGGNCTGIGFDNLGIAAEENQFEFRGLSYRFTFWLKNHQMKELFDINKKYLVTITNPEARRDEYGIPYARGIVLRGTNEEFQRVKSLFEN